MSGFLSGLSGCPASGWFTSADEQQVSPSYVALRLLSKPNEDAEAVTCDPRSRSRCHPITALSDTRFCSES
jgi:hypothetical protein